jgi:hypothetical protein
MSPEYERILRHYKDRFTCLPNKPVNESRPTPPCPVTEIRLKRHPHVTFSFTCPRNLLLMRGAFVIRLGRGTNPSDGHFEGSIEEVDSGRELKFQSLTELLRFLGERFQAAFQERLENDRKSGTPERMAEGKTHPNNVE